MKHDTPAIDLDPDRFAAYCRASLLDIDAPARSGVQARRKLEALQPAGDSRAWLIGTGERRAGRAMITAAVEAEALR